MFLYPMSYRVKYSIGGVNLFDTFINKPNDRIVFANLILWKMLNLYASDRIQNSSQWYSNNFPMYQTHIIVLHLIWGPSFCQDCNLDILHICSTKIWGSMEILLQEVLFMDKIITQKYKICITI